MAEAFVELGAEGINYFTEKHYDRVYDRLTGAQKRERAQQQQQQQQGNNQQQEKNDQQQGNDQQQHSHNQYRNEAPSAVSGRSRRTQKNRLPEPEGDYQSYHKENYRDRRRDSQRSASLDRESEQSEQVIRAYENDRRDPPRPVESVLTQKDLSKLRRDSRMSHANGYANTSLQPPGYNGRRPQGSQTAPRGKYYDDDDSDYDERYGRRYKSTGRGYDDGYDDDRGYDREIVETERYRGPPRQSYGTRGETSRGNEPYGAGAVTQYRRSAQDVSDMKSRQSRSRGGRDRDRDRDSSSSSSGSRSRSRSRSAEGIRGKIEENFDTSMRGLGVGIAGAVVGGFAAKEFAGNKKHQNRDMILGALVGGLGANAAETKWRDWQDNKEKDSRREEGRTEQRYDGRGEYGRSRSAMR
ncbi:hypothetical protein LTR37_000284 [Vermiconidia calcicola]|uniref:Uncharacterized protein n=1 Tax=Vermiconidia calcicola TaxID=1690605 RepID=A0ACC3NZY7_9PEZI|nr:hypothetical protein LTR37_000284 [Vermiconidia calcicola]